MKIVLIILTTLIFHSNGFKSPTMGYQGPYQIGDVVNDFKLRSLNGKYYSLSSYPSAKAFVIVFTSNYCPFSRSYEDRLIAIDKKYTVRGVPVITINSNNRQAFEEETLKSLQQRSDEKSYNFPTLLDDNQQIARDFGATRSPQAYVLSYRKNVAVLQYAGAIDDNPQDPNGVSKNYVEDALNSILNNSSPAITETKPVGCAIKFN